MDLHHGSPRFKQDEVQKALSRMPGMTQMVRKCCFNYWTMISLSPSHNSPTIHSSPQSLSLLVASWYSGLTYLSSSPHHIDSFIFSRAETLAHFFYSLWICIAQNRVTHLKSTQINLGVGCKITPIWKLNIYPSHLDVTLLGVLLPGDLQKPPQYRYYIVVNNVGIKFSHMVERFLAAIWRKRRY